MGTHTHTHTNKQTNKQTLVLWQGTRNTRWGAHALQQPKSFLLRFVTGSVHSGYECTVDMSGKKRVTFLTEPTARKTANQRSFFGERKRRDGVESSRRRRGLWRLRSGKQRLAIATWNILDARNSRMAMACRDLAQHGIDIAVLTETKLSGFCPSEAFGYSIVAAGKTEGRQGGVALVVRTGERRGWHLEDTTAVSGNVVRATLVFGRERIVLVGCYIPPTEASLATVGVIEEITRDVDHDKLILLGDLNIRLHRPSDDRQMQIAEALAGIEVRDLARSFKARRSKPHIWTWQRADGGARAVCDYVLTGRGVRWTNCQVVDMQFPTDHRLVRGTLSLSMSPVYRAYMHRRTRAPVPLFPRKGEPTTHGTQDDRLATLSAAVPKEATRRTLRPSWITDKTFACMTEKRKALDSHDAEGIRLWGREVSRSLRKDRQARWARVSREALQCAETGDTVGAFAALKPWYRRFTRPASLPSEATLDATRRKFADLFTEDTVGVGTVPFDFDYEGREVDDSVPHDDEIRRALFRMRSRKAPGLSRVSVDLLKSWYTRAHPREGDPEPRAAELWRIVVDIVQTCLNDGVPPTAFRMGILVLIPKNESGDVRGIGLLEAVHKLVSTIVNLRMASAIQFCDAVHGFRRGRGCHTAIGDAKLRMQRAICQSTPLFQVFLDLRKAYDSVHRPAVMHLLERYGVGPRLRTYISATWDDQRFVVKQRGFFGEPLAVRRGVTQGDVDSPIIFNVIVDAALRHLRGHTDFRGSDLGFYADDGLIEHTSSGALQSDLDVLVNAFARVGLRANETKTKFMVVRGPPVRRARRLGRPTGMEATKVSCPLCEKLLTRRYLKQHMDTQHRRRLPQVYLPHVEGPAGFVAVTMAPKGRKTQCPVCAVRIAGAKWGVYSHFAHVHPEASLIVVGDGLRPKCERCGWHSDDVATHQEGATCRKIAARRRNEALATMQARADLVSFTVAGRPIERVTSFDYLGRLLSERDEDSTCIATQVLKARKRWLPLRRLLVAEGVGARVMGRFYVAIVQAVLLYGAESWTITTSDWRRLRTFHNQVVRYITRCHILKRGDGTWEIPDHEVLRRKCGLETIETYVERRRGTLREYLDTSRRELLESVSECQPPPLHARKVLWWKQPWRRKSDGALVEP